MRNYCTQGCSKALFATFLLCLTVAPPARALPARPEGSAAAVRVTAPLSLMDPLATYDDRTAGIRFVYPKAWEVKRNPEKDTLAAIPGVTAAGRQAEIKLTTASDPMTVDQYVALIETFYLKKLDGYKNVQEERVRFGRSGQLEGIRRTVSFNIGDTRYCQVWTSFQHDDRPLSFIFTCQEKQLFALNPLFNSVLVSVELFSPSLNGASASHSYAPATAPPAWNLVSLKVPNDALSFSYPSLWHLEADRERSPEIQAKITQLEVKATGKNSQGIDGEIHLFAINKDPEMSLDQFAHLVEQEHFAGLKDRRKLSEQRRNFGWQRMEGLSQTMSFTADGIPCKLMTVLFAGNERFYCLWLMSPWKEPEMRELFDKVLATIRFQGR